MSPLRRKSSISLRDSYDNTSRLHDEYIYPASPNENRTHHSRLAFSVINVNTNIGRSRKASPTVSLTNTNANASCINTSIFSSPTSFDLDFYSSKRSAITPATSPSSLPLLTNMIVSESDSTALLRVNKPPPVSHDVDVEMEPEPARVSYHHSRTSRFELRRRRSQSRFPQTAYQTHLPPANTRQQRMRSANGTGGGRSKISKLLSSDVQFLSTMHRSILFMIALTSVEDAMVVDGEEARFELKIQDELLLLRLEHHLCQPCRQRGSALHQSPVVESPLTHMTRPTLSISPPVETSLTQPPSPPSILSMPQLVAALILRHKERYTIRSPSPGQQPRPRSPLSDVTSFAL